MEVTRYLFQPTSTSMVQVGRPDPSVQREQKSKEDGEKLAEETNETLKEAQSFATSITQDVEPKVNPDKNLQSVIEVEKAQEIAKTEPTAVVAQVDAAKEVETKAIEVPEPIVSPAVERSNFNSIWKKNSDDSNSFGNIWSRNSDNDNNSFRNIWNNRRSKNEDSINNIWTKIVEDIQSKSVRQSNETSGFDFGSRLNIFA